MGFRDFWKKVFSGDDDAELKAARARHGITFDERDKKEAEEEEKEPFDPWEEVRNARTSFFLGTWASRKFHIIGEDKVKAKLEELEKKSLEAEALRQAQGKEEGKKE
jgi:hypothetical protein